MVDFRINIIADPRRVPRGTRVVERQLTRVENRSDALRASLGRTFGFLAGGAAIIGAVRNIAQFEESIATARAVSGATAEQFENLRDRALELGVSTRFSARQAADALVNLSRAGFTVTEAIESVDDTLRLAQAAGLGLAEAAGITASTLRGFRLEVEDAARVTDVLTQAANSANTNVSQLGEGIKFVAPVAAGLSQSLELTTAALGVLSDAGLQATLAGTGLRRVLAELESPSSASQKILAELGVTAEEVRVSQVGLVEALQRLREAGIDTGQALELFGQRGGPAFEVLVSNIPQIERLNDRLENSAGVAERVAGIIDDTLNGALLRARSALEGFVLALGQAGTSDFLIAILDGISVALRFLAENAELVTAAAVGLATAISARLAASLLTSLLPALRSATLALVLYRGNLVALIADTVRARAATVAAAAPFAVLGAAVAGATLLLREQNEILKDISRSFEQLEEDAKFAQIGTQIRQASQELRNLERAVAAQEDRGFGASDTQIARIEKLKNTIADLRGEARQQAEAAREVDEAQQAQAVTVENLIGRLDREAAALRDLTRETRLRQQFEQELQTLLQAGQVPTAEERDLIRARLEQNEALRAQREILEQIRGPQEDFRRQQAALQGLLDRGAITVDEFNAKLRELRGEFDDGGIAVDAQNGLESLREQNDLLQIQVNQGEFVAEAIRLENQLREEGVEITREVQDQIAEQLLRERELTEEIERRTEREREAERLRAEAARTAEREQQRLERLAMAIDLTEQQAEAERRVKEAFDAGLVSKESAAQALADVQLRGLEASTSLEDGFSRAFAKIAREAEDLAAVGEQVVNVFADRATDALVEFATTGQFSFREFANAILQDLTRIIARLLIVQALNAAFGGGAGTAAGAGASLAGSRQEGGTVQPARSFLVGENGPELFVPDRTGTVVPNAADRQQPQPLNVQVVNVQSEDEIPQAINNGAADEAIINAIARNKDRVNQVTQ